MCPLYDVIIVDHVFVFKTGPKHTFFFSKVFDCRSLNLLPVLFLSCDVILEFSGSRSFHIYKATRFLLMQSEERMRVTESIERRIACYSVVLCCRVLA